MKEPASSQKNLSVLKESWISNNLGSAAAEPAQRATTPTHQIPLKKVRKVQT